MEVRADSGLEQLYIILRKELEIKICRNVYLLFCGVALKPAEESFVDSGEVFLIISY